MKSLNKWRAKREGDSPQVQRGRETAEKLLRRAKSQQQKKRRAQKRMG